jgi:deazaflavin-dependent oxidoreductase (nitroreductase family)
MDQKMAERLQRMAGNQTLTLAHRGRKTGKEYQVTIWFMVDGERIFLPTANVGRSWVRNVRKTPHVRLKIGAESLDGEARFLSDASERERVFAMVRRKYWWAFPMIAFAQVMTALGLIADTGGAFEVTIAAA